MHDKLSDTIYREEIMELYKSPENYGTLKNPDREHTENNATCGDEITIQLIIHDDKIKDAKFHGSGCVISIVSSSMLINKLKGMNIEEIQKINKDDMLKLFKAKISLGRIKCLLLPLNAVKNALKLE